MRYGRFICIGICFFGGAVSWIAEVLKAVILLARVGDDEI